MEKKKRNLIIGIAAAVVLVIVLCLVCCRRSSDKYCSAIPKDALGICRVDAASFIKKHDIDLDGLKSLMGGMDGMLDKTGIDLEKPIYLFAASEGAGLVAKMKSTEDLKTLVKGLGTMLGAKLSEKQGYNWIEMNEVIVCFDADKLLALSGAGMNARKKMIALMEQDEDESVMGTKLFDSVEKIEQPFAIVSNMSTLLSYGDADAQSYAIAQVANYYNLKPEDVDMNISITFDVVKDKAILAFNSDPTTPALKEKLDEFGKMIVDNNTGKYINTIASDPLVWGSAHIDGSKWGKMFKEAFDAQLANMGTSTEALALKTVMDSMVKVIESFDGDISITIPALDGPNVNFMVQGEVRDKSILTALDMLKAQAEQAGENHNIMKNGDSYTLAVDESMVFVGVKNDQLYISNSTDLTAKLGKEVDSRVDDLKKDICNSFFYLTVDAQPLIGLLMQNSSMKMALASIIGRLSQLDRLTFRSTSYYCFEVSLSVRDGKDFIETLCK